MINFILGLIVGGCLGVGATCLIVAGSRFDDANVGNRYYKNENNEIEKETN